MAAAIDLSPILAKVLPVLVPELKALVKQFILTHLDEILDEGFAAATAAALKATTPTA